MYSDTRFGQILKGLPRPLFEKIVAEENADKYTKGFRCWDQLLAMTFNQLSGATSLRQLEASFNSQPAAHYHLGTQPLKRSTLADANAKRSSRVFERLFQALLPLAKGRMKHDLKEFVYLMDASVVHLAGAAFDAWAKQYRNNVSQGLKLHLAIEQQAQCPVFGELSGADKSDLSHGRNMPLEAGATYVFDRGYYDFDWWHQIQQADALFVTRLKKNAAVEVVTSLVIPTKDHDTVLEDAIVRFTRKYNGKHNRPNPYWQECARRVVVDRPDKATPLILITNDFERSAAEIAELYQKRWGIELFFKWIKQNLKIKRFLGRSEQAVRTQIYVALITYLLLYLYRKSQAISESFMLCLTAVQTTLLQRPETAYQVAKRRRLEREAFLRQQPGLEF
jgi:hypothetical protein